MRVYIKDMDEFFRWMDSQSAAYVVLRGFEDYLGGYPPVGGKADVDMLVEDRAVEMIIARYGSVSKRAGVKCDVYSVHAVLQADYLGLPYYPELLAQNILDRRQLWNGAFYVPCAEDYLFSLIYHIAYQKAETSGFQCTLPDSVSVTKYHPILKRLALDAGISIEFCLLGFHSFLRAHGYGLDRERLIKYIQNDFKQGRKSYFYAVLADEFPGEINLFVIRKVAVKAGLHTSLIETLARHYKILRVKEIPWVVRFKNSRHMRGGKWRRGGKPYIAVVVFDANPVRTSDDDRKVHPFVFNSTQFIKRDIREWVAANARVRKKDNAIHSTDNEAEAIGHLPLFFSQEEQANIFLDVARLRGALTADVVAQEAS